MADETSFIPVRGNDINNTSVENGQFLINPATKRAYIDAPVRDGAAAERTMLYGDAFVNIDNNGTITTADGNTKSVSLGKTYTGKLPISISDNNEISVNIGGGLKIGTGTGRPIEVDAVSPLTINTQAKLAVDKATTGSFGVVKIGSNGNINVNDGTISVPKATTSIPGVVKVGSGLSVDNGLLNCTVTNTWKQNTKDSEGYVLKGNGHGNSVWMTDNDGNPGWQEQKWVPLSGGANDEDNFAPKTNKNAMTGTLSWQTGKLPQHNATTDGKVYLALFDKYNNLKWGNVSKLYEFESGGSGTRTGSSRTIPGTTTAYIPKMRWNESQLTFYDYKDNGTKDGTKTINYYERGFKFLVAAFNNTPFIHGTDGVYFISFEDNESGPAFTKFKIDFQKTFDGPPFVFSGITSGQNFPVHVLNNGIGKDSITFSAFSNEKIEDVTKPDVGVDGGIEFTVYFLLYGVKTVYY